MGRSTTNPHPEPLTSHHIHLPHIHLPGHGQSKDPINSGKNPNVNRLQSTSGNSSNVSSNILPATRTNTNSKGKGVGNGSTKIRNRGDGRGLTRENSVQTRYMDMLLGLDTIPRLHTILASFFTWILLAGFIIFPGTFTALGHVDNPTLSSSQTAKIFFQSVKNIPLLVVAGVCCGIGAGGMLWLWWTWRRNYVWLLNKIFLPGCLNSFAGLISTLVNVYAQQDGVWNITAEVTAIVSGSVMAITALLFALYNFWVLARVKRSHSRDMRRDDAPREGEGLREKVERVAMQPGLEPGSVV